MTHNDFNTDTTGIIKQWWKTLVNSDPGGAATLRRANSTLDVMVSEQFYELVEKTGLTTDNQIEKLACIAMTISHVKTDSNETMPARMGAKNGNIDHVVSESRLYRLISSDLTDATRQLIRILPMIDYSANICSLAESMWYWDYESQFSKKKWVKEYYLTKKRRGEE